MIKNGFVKTIGNKWINLNYVKELYADSYYGKGFRIKAKLDGYEKDITLLIDSFQSYEEAEAYLEKIIWDAHL
ncbi:MAG: hypothetical protein ACYC0F_18465 [Rhodanobacter sp.]